MGEGEAPLSQILRLLLANALSFLRLVLHDKGGVLVEDGVLAAEQGLKVAQRGARVDVCWSGTHQAVRLLDHGTNVKVVPMVEEILHQLEREERRENACMSVMQTSVNSRTKISI